MRGPLEAVDIVCLKGFKRSDASIVDEQVNVLDAAENLLHLGNVGKVTLDWSDVGMLFLQGEE